MFLYFVPVFIFTCFALFTSRDSFSNRCIFYITFFYLVFFIGLRNEIGTDWDLIYTNFLGFQSAFESSGELVGVKTEPIYTLISFLSNTFNSSIYGVNLICALIFFIGFFRFISTLKRPWLALVFAYPYYILVASINFNRQSAAIGIVLLAFIELLNNKKFNFILLTLLASATHFTALITLPLILSSDSIFSKRYLAKTLLFLLLFALIFSLSGYFSLKYNSLLGNFFESGIIYVSQGLWLRVVPLLASFALILTFRKRLNISNYIESVYIISGVLVSALALIASVNESFSTISDRLSAYFLPLLLYGITIFPDFSDRFNLRANLATFLICLYSLALTLSWLAFSFYSKNYWIPYKNILFTNI